MNAARRNTGYGKQEFNTEVMNTMNSIKSLDRYQKAILIIMVMMSLIFAVIYPKTISKVGYRYNDTILVPTQKDGNTLYSGKIREKQACFTVSDHSVVFQYGDKTYGPYTVNVDPTAIPKENGISGYMVGIEIHDGDSVYFRGGVMDLGDSYWLSSKDGTYDSMLGFSAVTSDGIERDANGEPIDRTKPSPSTIYELLNNPKLSHKGEALGWFGAMLICILNAISIIFADLLFRWNVAFRIRNVDDAEPSDLEIAGRYICWTVMTIIALVLFITGLQ